MVDIKPFHALRYARVSPDNMGDVTSPPYDVFNNELQDLYYKKHPNNIVRLIQGRIELNENGDEERVSRAIEFLKEWKFKNNSDRMMSNIMGTITISFLLASC